MSIDKMAEVIVIGAFFMMLVSYLTSALIAFYYRVRTKFEIDVMTHNHAIQQDRFEKKMRGANG